MARVCSLFSGSSGNCIFIGTPGGSLLVDAGASLKGICEGLAGCGASPEEICAVAVTHEHIDHVKGLRALLKKTGAVLIASEQTAAVLAEKNLIPPETRVLPIGEQTIALGGVGVTRFPTSHDCEGSSGYKITLPDGKTVSVCTDLGVVTQEVHTALAGSSLVFLESNHDIEMLKRGPYPPQLKLRILSEKGHISNSACAAEAARLFGEGTERFVLCHLSQKNNLPMLAQRATEAALIDLGAESGTDYLLQIAAPSGNEVCVL